MSGSAKLRLFNRYWSLASLACLVVDACLLLLAVWTAYHIRFSFYFGRLDHPEPPFFYAHFSFRALIFVLTVVVNLYFNELYSLTERLTKRTLAIKLARSLLLSAVVLTVLYYLTYPYLTTGRGVFALAMVFSGILLMGWRLLLASSLKSESFAERVLIVGADSAAVSVAREILARKHLGYRVIGFLADDPRLQGKSLINPKVIGTTSQVLELARANRASRVVVAQLDRRGKLNVDRLLECKTFGFPVETGSSYYERLSGKILLSGLRKSWLVFSDGFLLSSRTRWIKALMDRSIAALGLLASLPLMAGVAVAIRLDSPGPVFYSQRRVGLRGRPFTLWKFRSMRNDAESGDAPQWAEQGDPRVTRVGRLLRKLRIDELPQLWNVLIGNMALVGPRPERPEFVEQLKELSPIYEQRLTVRPGITGWAQIQAAYAGSFEESLDKLEFDLYYVKHMSPLFDLSILASTIKIVLLGRGSR